MLCVAAAAGPNNIANAKHHIHPTTNTFCPHINLYVFGLPLPSISPSIIASTILAYISFSAMARAASSTAKTSTTTAAAATTAAAGGGVTKPARAAKTKATKKTTASTGTKKISPYNQYMKEQLPIFKKNNPGVDHKEAFRSVAAQWAAAKENPKNQSSDQEKLKDKKEKDKKEKDKK